MTGSIFQVTKIDAAVDQLDWAIRLFLDHQAYLPAITLAHAAERILQENIVNSGGTSALFQIADRLSELTGKPEKEVRKFMNQPATWLKHWSDRTDPETLEEDLESAAIGYILRASINLREHDRRLAREMARFREWLVKHRPDIDPMQDPFTSVDSPDAKI